MLQSIAEPAIMFPVKQCCMCDTYILMYIYMPLCSAAN